MQWVRRAGASRTWAYLKPWPTSPSTWSDETRRSSIRITAWPPGMVRSMVSRMRSVTMAGSFMSVRNRVAPSSVLAMMMPHEAPSAPVISHFWPEMTQWLPSWRAVVFIIEGSEPAPPSGSVIRKAERVAPLARGRRNCSFWSWLATFSSRHMLPSSGAMQFIATGPSSE